MNAVEKSSALDALGDALVAVIDARIAGVEERVWSLLALVAFGDEPVDRSGKKFDGLPGVVEFGAHPDSELRVPDGEFGRSGRGRGDDGRIGRVAPNLREFLSKLRDLLNECLGHDDLPASRDSEVRVGLSPVAVEDAAAGGTRPDGVA